jgi:type II secretory pathway pseudopilin PulG
MLGIGFAASVTTQAQYQNGQWQRQRQREYEREQRRRQREYERAQRQQQRQAERYGSGNNGGYNNSGYYGGYRNNDNYSNYGGSYEFRQTALNAGYNAGVKAGRDDRSRGRSYNYADESEYRNADKDYSSRYGNRAMYQQYFREAFVNGYSDGYRGY